MEKLIFYLPIVGWVLSWWETDKIAKMEFIAIQAYQYCLMVGIIVYFVLKNN